MPRISREPLDLYMYEHFASYISRARINGPVLVFCYPRIRGPTVIFICASLTWWHKQYVGSLGSTGISSTWTSGARRETAIARDLGPSDSTLKHKWLIVMTGYNLLNTGRTANIHWSQLFTRKKSDWINHIHMKLSKFAEPTEWVLRMQFCIILNIKMCFADTVDITLRSCRVFKFSRRPVS